MDAQSEEVQMAAQGAEISKREPRLAHMPVAFFATVMGLSGLTLAWTRADHALGLATGIPTALAAVTAGVFVVLASFYAAKAVLYPKSIVEEYNHPVRLHFIPTISISLILLSVIAIEHLPMVAQPLFVVGAALHIASTMVVLHNWFNRDHFQTAHLNPAWFIPIVGNVLVPLAGMKLGYVELSWFFYSIGIVFWVVLFAIITNRVLFHQPLPERLAPTMFILIAPPAVGFLSYVRLTDEIDAAARILYYFALFMTFFLATQVPRVLRQPFFLSWWAYSFPLAAITVATWVMAERIGGLGFEIIAIALLATVTLVVLGLVIRTLVAILRHEVCEPE